MILNYELQYQGGERNPYECGSSYLCFEDTFPVAYDHYTFVFIADPVSKYASWIYPGSWDAEEDPKLRKINILAMEIVPLSPQPPNAISPNSLFQVDAFACGNIMLLSHTVFTFCAEKNASVLYKYSILDKALEKFVLFRSDANIYAPAYLPAPLQLDRDAMIVKIMHPVTNLGDGIRSFPKGTVDLKTGIFTPAN